MPSLDCSRQGLLSASYPTGGFQPDLHKEPSPITSVSRARHIGLVGSVRWAWESNEPFGLQSKVCRLKTAARRWAAGALFLDDSGEGA